MPSIAINLASVTTSGYVSYPLADIKTKALVVMMDSTSGYPAAKSQRVTRPKEFTEQLSFLAKEGTAARIEAVRGDVMKADFLRMAVDEAIRKAAISQKRQAAREVPKP